MGFVTGLDVGRIVGKLVGNTLGFIVGCFVGVLVGDLEGTLLFSAQVAGLGSESSSFMIKFRNIILY